MEPTLQKQNKQTNKHTLNKNNWASNKDGEKCRLFIERENKTKTEHLTSVTWIYYKKSKQTNKWQNDWNKTNTERGEMSDRQM